jgi:hypothetical protein
MLRHQSEKVPGLDVIIIHASFLIILGRVARNLQRWLFVSGILYGAAETVWLIIHRRSGVAIKAHKAVTLIVVHFCYTWPVYRQMFVVDAQPVSMRVCIGEDARLKHFAGRKRDGRHK